MLSGYLTRVEHNPSGRAARLYPFPRLKGTEQPRSVVMDLYVSFGKPFVAGIVLPAVQVITAVERRLVLGMWNYAREGKKDDPAAAVRSLVHRLRGMGGAGQAEVVVMDVSRQFRAAVEQALPQVKIVVDRFHLRRMANVAVDCAGKRLNKRLRKDVGGRAWEEIQEGILPASRRGDGGKSFGYEKLPQGTLV